MGQSGLDQNPISDTHLLVDLGQPPPSLNHNILICKMGIRIVSSQGHCENRTWSCRGLGPGLARSRGTIDRSPSLPPQAPVPSSCRAALLSMHGRACIEGNYPGRLARAQLLAEHLPWDLIPEQSILVTA